MTALLTISKLILTATFLYILSEIAKRSTLIASLLASLPVTAILTGTLLYWETSDAEYVATFMTSVLWLIVPSLIFFFAFPFFLRRGINFSLAMILSISVMAVFYGVYAMLLRWLAIKL